MDYDNLQFDYSLAIYLRTIGYNLTLESFIAESPHLRGKAVDDFGTELSKEDYDNLAVFLHKNSGAYTTLVQAVHQMETAMASMKYGLRLTNRTLSVQSRLYRSHTTVQRTVNNGSSVVLQPTTSQNGNTSSPPVVSKRMESGVRMESSVQSESIQCQPITPKSQQRQPQLLNQVMNASTPTRRQLFSSPSKRKTPNPKHQLTPVPERDLLEEALKLASISPVDWDKRVSDSAVPLHLATAINNARTNTSGNSQECEEAENSEIPIGRSGHCEKSTEQLVNIEEPAEQSIASKDSADGQMNQEEQSEQFNNRENPAEQANPTEAVVSETMYQIGMNPDFFQSLDQLFAPEYNDPDVSAMEDDVNQFSKLSTSSFILTDSNSPLKIGFNNTIAGCSAPLNMSPRPSAFRSSPYKRILPTTDTAQRLRQSPIKTATKRSIVVARSLFTEPNERYSPKKIRLSGTNQQQNHVPLYSTSETNSGQRTVVGANGTTSHSKGSRLSGCRQSVGQPEVKKTLSVGSKKSQESGQNRYPRADLITPDRVDELMKRLHKPKGK